MKTFLVLFAIAVSLPTEAQRVTENVKQRLEIVDISAQEEVVVVEEVVKEDPKGKKKAKLEKSP